MLNYLTKTQAEELKLKSAQTNSHNVGELYPEIFDCDKELSLSKITTMDVALLWFGAFEIDNDIFPKITCPICGKQEVLIPYFCGASILTGCHVIKFYCQHCNELIAFNNISDYYHKIRDYIIKNKETLKPSDKIKVSHKI